MKNRIEHLYRHFKQLKEEDVCEKRRSKWSKKEILGHLCDSAVNNIYRFMYLQKPDQVLEIVKYDQELWVKQAGYAGRPWQELVTYWYSLNMTVLGITEEILKSDELQVTIDGECKSAQFLIEDYCIHLEHHAKQIMNGKV